MGFQDRYREFFVKNDFRYGESIVPWWAKLMEEQGEFLKAFCALQDTAPGDWVESKLVDRIESELADIVLICYGIAENFHLNLDIALEKKLEKILGRKGRIVNGIFIKEAENASR